MKLQAKSKEQRERILEFLCDVNYVDFEGVEDGIYIDGHLSFDTMGEIVDFLRQPQDKHKELFEECWVAYDRKGSKKKSYDQWVKLKDKEKDLVMPHIKAYVANRERQYRKDFERYLRDKTFLDVISNGNNVVFDPSKREKGAYCPQGRTIWYDENAKSYWTDDNFYYGDISDGYTDDNRPDGATLTMSNARGVITWNGLTKTWEKK